MPNVPNNINIYAATALTPYSTHDQQKLKPTYYTQPTKYVFSNPKCL